MSRHDDLRHPLYGCTLKLRRANEHLETLERAVQGFRGRNPHEFRTQLDPESGEYCVWTRIREMPPPDWSLIVGDIVHNLRSALDHLAYQLVIKAGGEPTNRTSFPIFHDDPFTKTHKGARNWRDRVAGMLEDDVALIKSLQPYQQRYVPEADPPEDHILFTLNELWNADKHRQLIVTLTFHTGAEFGIEHIQGYEFELLAQRPPGPCENGTVIALYRLTPTAPDPEVEMNVDVTFEIGLVEARLPDPLELLRTLRMLGDHVADIVDDFTTRFD